MCNEWELLYLGEFYIHISTTKMNLIINISVFLILNQMQYLSMQTNVNRTFIQHEIEFEKLYGTWYVKQILINGKEDLENFPTNNDELTFNRNMTIISVDKTYDLIDKGTWKIKNPDMIIINTEDDSTIFQILKLSSKELETKMISDDIDMIIKYKRSIE